MCRDSLLEASIFHGVTTVVMGNWGVGFAPADPNRHDWLISLLEGVEDIPGTALAEGLSRDWESFPEYLDAIEKRPHSIDFAALRLHRPEMQYDLPAGGKPLVQKVEGYRYTIVRGEVVVDDGTPTGAMHGKLVRGAPPTGASEGNLRRNKLPSPARVRLIPFTERQSNEHHQ